MLRSSALFLAIAAGLPLTAVDLVEVHLRSGQVAKGELISQDGGSIVVTAHATGKGGRSMSITMTYRRDDIETIVDLGDPEEAYAKRLSAAASAADHAALAAWCADMGMAARALAQAERAVDLDPGQEACVTMALDAGWVRSHGAWAREVDVLAADGKVRYQGRIMTISAADGLKASARKQAALAAAQQLVDERVHAVAYCDRLLAEIGTRSPDLEIELTMAKADVAIAEATPAKVYAARTALDSAQANLDQARSSPPSGSPATASSYLASYDQAVTSAQVALAAAKKAEAGAAADLPRLRGRVGALTDEKRNLERKLNDLGLKRAAALKAQAQARSDAARAADDEQGTADRTAASAIPAATAAPSAASSAPSAAKP